MGLTIGQEDALLIWTHMGHLIGYHPGWGTGPDPENKAFVDEIREVVRGKKPSLKIEDDDRQLDVLKKVLARVAGDVDNFLPDRERAQHLLHQIETGGTHSVPPRGRQPLVVLLQNGLVDGFFRSYADFPSRRGFFPSRLNQGGVLEPSRPMEVILRGGSDDEMLDEMLTEILLDGLAGSQGLVSRALQLAMAVGLDFDDEEFNQAVGTTPEQQAWLNDVLTQYIDLLPRFHRLTEQGTDPQALNLQVLEELYTLYGRLIVLEMDIEMALYAAGPFPTQLAKRFSERTRESMDYAKMSLLEQIIKADNHLERAANYFDGMRLLTDDRGRAEAELNGIETALKGALLTYGLGESVPTNRILSAVSDRLTAASPYPAFQERREMLSQSAGLISYGSAAMLQGFDVRAGKTTRDRIAQNFGVHLPGLKRLDRFTASSRRGPRMARA